MDPREIGVEERVPEKFEEGEERGLPFCCELYDAETVHKIAQAFLPGLSSACVDNTRGDIFRSPGAVAADIRKEMTDYLTQRSETFVAEHVVLDGGLEADISHNPFDIVSDFIDDFATTKRNWFSQVSGWLLSERREDDIDDFAQEMEINGFWSMDRREQIAQTLLKNVDFKNLFHCGMRFKTLDQLVEHVDQCGYRSVNCENEGCNAFFCASQIEKHDSCCPFKLIPCEQNCSQNIMRREMDRHCITVCPMKLVNCPFYGVGCQATVPQCEVEEHRLKDLRTHLMCILRNVYKEASTDDLEARAELVEKSSSRLDQARNARSLTYLVRDLDTKLGQFEKKAENKVTAEVIEATNAMTHLSEEAETKASEVRRGAVQETDEGTDTINTGPHELKQAGRKALETEDADNKGGNKTARETEDIETQNEQETFSEKKLEAKDMDTFDNEETDDKKVTETKLDGTLNEETKASVAHPGD